MTLKTVTPKTVTVGDLKIANDRPFTLLAGPCQIENRDHAEMLAGRITEIAGELGIPVIFKASYDKANRSSLSGKRGIGIDKGLEILAGIREKFGCPVVTDVHTAEQAVRAAEAVDVLQIPAFLCRQTDLLLAAGETGRAINVKKGQFLAPWDMRNVADKVASTGNENIMLCERGTSFGYNALVSDFRGLPIMAETGYPVVFDATHSVQQPGGLGGSTGGQREFVPVLARAALAVGAAAVFLEVHDDPDNAPSDGPNMVHLADLEPLLKRLKAFDDLAKAG
ncbi:3-deoxy-8-phosphooctulonate synthase [Chachezhania sediminis]|uniref:3-deoxy-8-phosphooctulonate synthase n=1 Tax=Chachezhania sediminis TaxID=2599291 RepID=UPI00131B090B|nr:3-deoxy-8-phosphooctulonate synthase [Chachezhania sediminis]